MLNIVEIKGKLLRHIIYTLIPWWINALSYVTEIDYEKIAMVYPDRMKLTDYKTNNKKRPMLKHTMQVQYVTIT